MSTVCASAFLIIALRLSICAIHLGFNKQMFKAFIISICMVLVTWFVLFLACNGARIVGITFEVAAIAENVIHGDMHFEMLYYIITLFIATGIISNTIAMSVERMLKENVDSFNDRIAINRKVLASNVIILPIIIFALYIPNHLLLLSNKFLVKEILNSETFVSELIRFLVIVITTVISVPLVSLDIFGFGKKYIKAPNEVKEVNNTNNDKEETSEEVVEEAKEEVVEVVEEEKEEQEAAEEVSKEEVKEEKTEEKSNNKKSKKKNTK
jgi:hypothetical protein